MDALQLLAGWVGPIATMMAALMTAANLGSRVTGWGFVVFVVASVAWSIVGATSGQTNLLATNGFLAAVNAFGVWRWLGRQARLDDGGKAAARRSQRAPVPTLFSAVSLLGWTVQGRDGASLGTVVDAMLKCGDQAVAYIVIAEGGVAGVGERLHALDPQSLRIDGDSIGCDLSAAELTQLPALGPDNWPAQPPAYRNRQGSAT
jgi:hypothetical protein